MDISETGYWVGTPETRYFDIQLADAIVELLTNHQATFIHDLGCSHGDYVEHLRYHRFEAEGWDGNYAAFPPKSYGYHGFDLTWPLPTTTYKKHRQQWALSLEVGEHIPSQFTDAFIHNFSRLALVGGILSWAIPGQGGTGHVNCLTNEEVINLCAGYDLVHSPEESEFLRKSAGISWFKNTLMVFNRKVVL